MFYGLAHLESEFHVNNVHKVVQLAPCFYPVGETIDKVSATSM